jgi:DNA-binding transcriptional ArsR family regulator
MKKLLLIDCQNLVFSTRLAENRMNQAQQLFGSRVIQHILCYALYLLGANRKAIGQALGMSPETSKSIIKVINRDGLVALEDRRRQFSSFLPQASPEPQPFTLREEEDHIVIDFGTSGRILKISREDPLQVKTILLLMLNSGLLTKRQVAEAMKLSQSHTATLARRLYEQGAHSLVDQRQGQKQDYRVSQELKAELIQQFAVDVITSGRTSGSTISAKLMERCNIAISPRTVRHHLAQMGLGKIKRSLPQLVAAVKKISNNCCSI